MASGEVLAATTGGQITKLQLSTHDTFPHTSVEKNPKTLEAHFNKQLALNK